MWMCVWKHLRVNEKEMKLGSAHALKCVCYMYVRVCAREKERE